MPARLLNLVLAFLFTAALDTWLLDLVLAFLFTAALDLSLGGALKIEL